MKLHENNSQHMEAIARFLSGEMEEVERMAFEKSLNNNLDNQVLIEQMKRDWELMGQYKNNKEVNTNRAWEKLHGRFQEEHLIPQQKQIVMLPKRVKPMMQWAAIFVGIMVLGSVMFYMNNQSSTGPMVTLTTTNDPTALIQTLKDGSTVYLAGNTSFSYPEKFSQEERKVELKGEAYFDIARNPDKPFVIETSSATVEVLGTAFNVKSSNSKGFELIVERGKVRVTPKSGSEESFIVVAGEKLSVIANHFVKTKSDDNSHLVWNNNRIRFKDEQLGNIVKVLNDKYNSNIVVKGGDLATRKLTVTFNNSTMDTMIEVICATLDIRSESSSGAIILHESNGENRN